MAGSSSEMVIFQRVVERGSFARAADDVGLSPSAVAKLITRLEARLGVRLINRTTRRLALTPEGEILSRACARDSCRNRVRGSGCFIRAPLATRALARAYLPGHCRPSSRTGLAGFLDALPPDHIRFPGHQPNCRHHRRKRGHFAANGAAEQPGLVARKIVDLTRVVCASPSSSRATAARSSRPISSIIHV